MTYYNVGWYQPKHSKGGVFERVTRERAGEIVAEMIGPDTEIDVRPYALNHVTEAQTA